MKCICVYDERADVSQVQQHVAVDLEEAFVNAVLPSQVGDDDLQFGNIDGPSRVYGKPSDVFEAMQLNRSFKSALASHEPVHGATE